MAEHEVGGLARGALGLFAATLLASGCGNGDSSSIDSGTVDSAGGGDSNSVAIDAGVPDAGLIEGAYFVAPGGDDDDPGTIDLPWQTLAKAASTLTAGESVYVRAGTYSERLVPENDGASGQPITFLAYPGELPTIDGEGVTLPDGWGGLVEVDGRSHIVLSGLRVINAGPDDNHAGILVENSSYVTVEKCSTYDTVSSGIGVWRSDHIVIDQNEVILACNDGSQECITIALTDQFQVSGNRVHDTGPGSNGGEGIDIKHGSSNGDVFGNVVYNTNRLGIYVDSWDTHTYAIDVHQNDASDCGGSGFAVAAENGGLLEDVRIYNNIAYGNLYSGLTVGGWGVAGQDHPIAGVEIINNNFVDNGTDGWGPGIVLENPEADNIVIRNNILSGNGYEQLAVSEVGTGLVVDHNLFFGPGDPYGTDYQVGDPKLDPPGAMPYPDSPAVDNGSPTGAPDHDWQGTPRPWGDGFDIGAYEYFE